MTLQLTGSHRNKLFKSSVKESGGVRNTVKPVVSDMHWEINYVGIDRMSDCTQCKIHRKW